MLFHKGSGLVGVLKGDCHVDAWDICYSVTNVEISKIKMRKREEGERKGE